MTEIRAWIERRPVASFYLLAFLISWSGMLPLAGHSWGLFALPAGLFAFLAAAGPAVAAGTVTWLLAGWHGLRSLFAALLRWRVGIVWYFFALFWPPAIAFVAGLISGPTPASTSFVPWYAPLLAFMGHALLGAPLEEVGWRGFALPRLQARLGALGASLLIGLLWALWHVPLFVQKAYATPISSFPVWGALLLGNAILYTWLFNSTRGSLLLVTLFHASYNTAVSAQPSVQMAGLTWIAAILIVTVFGPFRLSGTRTN